MSGGAGRCDLLLSQRTFRLSPIQGRQVGPTFMSSVTFTVVEPPCKIYQDFYVFWGS